MRYLLIRVTSFCFSWRPAWRIAGPLLLLAWPRPVLGQKLPANANLPLEHWSMAFLEHLVRRGVLADPSPLMRPWHVKDLVRAMQETDTTALSAAERGTLREVLDELDGDTANARYVAGAGAGLAVSSYSRRPEFELRTAGPKRVTPEARAMLGFQFGPGLLMADGRWIQDLETDPDFAGELGHMLLKSDATYGLLRTRYFDLELGSLSRNWGPPGFPGVLVSDWPLAYDHVFLDLGPRRLHLSMLVTQLADAVNSSGQLIKRYFVAHRLSASPAPGLELALFQGTLFSGENRNLALPFLNPLQFTNIPRTQRREDTNVMLGGEGQLRAGRFILSGSFLGDDFDFTHPWEPYSFAGTATVATAIGPASAWIGYTLVSNLCYRSQSNPLDGPLTGIDPVTGGFGGTGLARNFSDYDELTFRVSIVPLPGLVARPEITLLRQGEGDPRLPFPPDSLSLSRTPTFLQGTVERTLRAALAATFHPFRGASIELTGGIHQISNAGHVSGVSRTRSVGSITARYVVQFGGRLEH